MKTTCTVLVVDDDEAQGYAIVRMLQFAQYRVIRATTGAEAVAAISGQQPDLIMLDINLPDANGFVIAQRLKADPNTRHVPVVFHSASSPPWAHEKTSGLAAFLTTPIEPDHLLHVIRGTLARAAARTESRQTAH